MQAHSVNENRTKDGRAITCEWFNTPLRDPDGRYAGAISLARDVTEQRRMEEQLAESRRRLRAVFENSLEAILLMDDKGRYVDANPAACRLLGYDRDELVRLTVSDVTTGADRGRIPELMSRFLAAGTLHGEYTLVCKGGATREVEYRSVANILPGLHLGVHRDITERKQGERALREGHALLRAVVEGIPDAVYVKDRRGRNLLANSAAACFVGRTPEQMLGRDDAAWFEPETAGRVMEADRRVMESGETETFEEVGTAAGITRTYLTTKAPFRDPNGEVIGVLGVSRDVTEPKRAEQELRRQKEVLQTIFDHIPVMLNFLDPDGRAHVVNREWERVLGWSLEEAQTRDLIAEFYPDSQDRQRVMEYICNPPPGWTDFKTRLRDGRTLDTSWSMVVLSDGTRIGIGQDITDRKRAEEALRESADRLQNLSRRLIEVQEAERRHLARELHDEVGQHLTGLRFLLNPNDGVTGDSARSRFEQARVIVDGLLEQVRGLSSDLRPAALDQLGLLPALLTLFERYTARQACWSTSSTRVWSCGSRRRWKRLPTGWCKRG